MTTKYLVFEIQTYLNGEIGTLITQHSNRNEAESKYHTVLAAAAISGLLRHCAVLMTNEGFLLETKCYELSSVPEESPSLIDETPIEGE